MAETLETKRFEFKIEDRGTGVLPRFVATTSPFHRGIYEKVNVLLPFIQVNGTAPRIIIVATPGERGIEVVEGFENAWLSHENRLLLHDLARQGMGELIELAPALEAARAEICIVARRMAPGFFRDPRRLGEIEIGFVRVGKCGGCDAYHFESVHGDNLVDALGSVGRTLAAIMRTLEAGKVPVLDPDGLLSRSGFIGAIIEELTSAMEAALRRSLVPIIGQAEDELVGIIDRERRILEQNRAALARAGVEVPAMKPQVLALIAACEKPGETASTITPPVAPIPAPPATPHDAAAPGPVTSA